MKKKIEFECPSCESSNLEEVMCNVTVTGECLEVEVEDGEILSIDYGDSTNDGGEISRYQCWDCGEVIAANQQELAEFLIKWSEYRIEEYEKASGNVVKDGRIYDSGGNFICEYSQNLAKNYLTN